MANDTPQILGSISASNPLTAHGPQPTDTSWVGASGQVDLTEPPPPWETGDPTYLASDARRFVGVPANWVLRWINPRLLESEGWRDWQPVLHSDPRVTVKVDTMRSPDGNVRRGGPSGDILCWMWQSWVESRDRQYEAATRRQTQSAVTRQQELRDEFARGKYGPNIRLEEARHPTHTVLDGRSLRQDL